MLLFRSGDELGKGHSIIRAWLFQRMALKRFADAPALYLP